MQINTPISSDKNNLYINDSIGTEETDNNTIYNSNSFNSILCTIEIPSINLYYPVYNSYSEELLEIGLCKFSGSDLTQNSNICIAGHNYNNGLFFSNLSKLSVDDSIFLFSNNQKIEYIIYEIFHVMPDEIDKVVSSNNKNKELTLVTCTNLNSQRLIIKAKNP